MNCIIILENIHELGLDLGKIFVDIIFIFQGARVAKRASAYRYGFALRRFLNHQCPEILLTEI